MNKVLGAIAGVVASAGVGGGAYALEVWAANSELHAVEQCVNTLDGKLEDECVAQAKEVRDVSTVTYVLELAGFVGVVGCGYLGYKAVKEEVGATGIIDDISS